MKDKREQFKHKVNINKKTFRWEINLLFKSCVLPMHSTVTVSHRDVLIFINQLYITIHKSLSVSNAQT